VRERCEVAIVGAGPVGLVLAILLARRGWRTAVLERWPRPYPLPRAVHFDHEIGRIFQAAGVADEVRALCDPACTSEWRNAAGETLLAFGREGVASLSGWPDSNMFHQPDLERVLERRLRALDCGALRRGVEVFELEPRARGVRVRARDAAGEVSELEADWLVGCDGANSAVRRSMHVPVEDLGLEADWLIVDLLLRRERRFRPKNWLLCDPARPVTAISGGPGRRRFELMRLPHESVEALHEPRTAWELLAPFDLSPADALIERQAVYSFRARWAESWRAGRLLIAGDAAHLLPPLAGQGLSSGLRDAATLAWQLDLVLARRAPEALLATYGAERLPHVRSLIAVSIDLGRLFCVTDREEALARDAHLAALRRANERSPLPSPPRMGQGTTLAGDRYAGELFVQGRVAARVWGVPRTGLFDDVVGRGWALVGADRDPADDLTPEQRRFFGSLGGVSAHVGPDAPVVDVDGRYAAFFARTGRRVALQRPDFHLFGTGKDPAGAGELVSALARQLAAPSSVGADEGQLDR
jgi:2-polyprenyl-6-methoxyphenol hydroxylase-like FAD-dependent oxidoreductase